MLVDRRPEILIIVDRPNWALDIVTENLLHAMGDKYRIVKKYQSEVTEADIIQADLVQVYYWLQLLRMNVPDSIINQNLHKLLIGYCGHVLLEGERREPGLAWMRKPRAVFAISQLLFREIQPLIDVPVFYAPLGVDTTFFTPGPPMQSIRPLRVGWVGSLDNHGPEQRGFYNLIVPATDAVEDVELVAAIRGEHWRSPEEMVELYRSFHVYICASRNEGGPNTCLEAAACGIPVVTTPVGNMPELIKPGVNGYLVEHNVDDIIRVLTLLRDDEKHRSKLGEAIRVSALAWDWFLLSDNFHQMYQFSLAVL